MQKDDQENQALLRQDAEEQKIENPAPQQVKERVYYADWYRTICVHCVVMVHTVQVVQDAIGGESQLSEITLEKKDGAVRCLCQIGIPSFFYLSGNTVTFFNCEKKGFCKFLYDKTTSLFLPWVILLNTILSVRLYFGQDFEPYNRPDEKNIENDFLIFYVKMWPKLIVKMSWLWFLLALYLDCLVVYPILNWTQRRYAKEPLGFKDLQLVIGQILIFGIYSYINLFMFGTSSAHEWQLPSVGVLAASFTVYYLIQLLPLRDYALLYKIIGVSAAVGLNFFKNGKNHDAIYSFVSQLNYDFIFLLQGIMDQVYLKEQLAQRDRYAQTLLVPLVLIGYYFCYSVTTPNYNKNPGYFYFYPMYEEFNLMTVHTTGTWMWIYVNIWVAIAMLNSKFSDRGHKLINGSSLWCYVIHLLFVVIGSKYVIYGRKWTFVPAVLAIFALTEGAVMLTWIFILQVSSLFKGTPKQKSLKNQQPALQEGITIQKS